MSNSEQLYSMAEKRSNTEPNPESLIHDTNPIRRILLLLKPGGSFALDLKWSRIGIISLNRLDHIRLQNMKLRAMSPVLYLIAAAAPELCPIMIVRSSQWSSDSMNCSQRLSRAVTDFQRRDSIVLRFLPGAKNELPPG